MKVKKSNGQKFVIITGMSGSGKGSALEVLEDYGYFCVDNLPVDLIPKFEELCREARKKITNSALVVDVRGGKFLNNLPDILTNLKKNKPEAKRIFLEASDRGWQRRFSETRRPHPLRKNVSLLGGIQKERILLKEIRGIADVIIDTTELNIHDLRNVIQSRYLQVKKKGSMAVTIQSFGFRFGIPQESDLVFDVRFLRNPNYVPELKKQSGRDIDVIKYIRSSSRSRACIKRLIEFLSYLLPNYLREGKAYLTISVGCTGGRHRSVMVAEDLGEQLSKAGFGCMVSHKDIHK